MEGSLFDTKVMTREDMRYLQPSAYSAAPGLSKQSGKRRGGLLTRHHCRMAIRISRRRRGSMPYKDRQRSQRLVQEPVDVNPVLCTTGNALTICPNPSQQRRCGCGCKNKVLGFPNATYVRQWCMILLAGPLFEPASVAMARNLRIGGEMAKCCVEIKSGLRRSGPR